MVSKLSSPRSSLAIDSTTLEVSILDDLSLALSSSTVYDVAAVNFKSEITIRGFDIINGTAPNLVGAKYGRLQFNSKFAYTGL